MPIEDKDYSDWLSGFQWNYSHDCYCDNHGHMMARDFYKAKVLEEEHRRRVKYEAAQRKKRQRLEAAVQKECAGCGSRGAWHDPDDYLCIICRDGKVALPDGAYIPSTSEIAA